MHAHEHGPGHERRVLGADLPVDRAGQRLLDESRARADDLRKVVLRLDLVLEVSVLGLESTSESLDLGVGLHVLDGQADLVCRVLEKVGVGLGILVRPRAGHRQDSNASSLDDQRHDHVRADTVLKGALFHRISALGAEVAAQAIALLPEYPADVALLFGHLHADGEIRRRQRGLEDEKAERLLLGVVEEDRRAIERHDATQGAGDRVEQSILGQIRYHRVVDLEQGAQTLGVGALGGRLRVVHGGRSAPGHPFYDGPSAASGPLVRIWPGADDSFPGKLMPNAQRLGY